MHIDEAGKDVVAFQINFCVAGKIGRVRHDIVDFSIFYQDAEACLHLHIPGTIQNFSICKCVIHSYSTILKIVF